MRGVAKTQAADPDRFEAVERRVADVKRCRRSDDGLFGRSRFARSTSSQVRLNDVASAF